MGALAAALTAAGCTTGHEPNGCDRDLQIAVDGGATVRFRWESGCVDASPSAPYRERPSAQEAPGGVAGRGPTIAEKAAPTRDGV